MLKKLILLILTMPFLTGCTYIIYGMASLHSLNPMPRRHFDHVVAQAKQGIPQAQLELANMLKRGCVRRGHFPTWRPPCDEKAAEQWYRSAAEKGSIEAQFALGQFYMTPRIPMETKEHSNEGIKWIKKAADQGYVPAYVFLGRHYTQEAQPNYSEAAKWYEKAAAKGDPYSQMALAEMYASGKGVAKNIDIARMWSLKVHRYENNIRMEILLGETFRGATPPDYQEAYYWIGLAAINAPNFQANGQTVQQLAEDLKLNLTAEQITEIDSRIRHEMALRCAIRIKAAHC